MGNNDNSSPFEVQLLRNIGAAKRRLKEDGVTEVGADNLFQCTATPSRSLKGAPAGTNSSWVYRQMFDKACGAGGGMIRL